MFYKICRFIFQILFALFWPIEIKQREAIKQRESLILAANHVSYLDPIVLGVAFVRPIHFIAKKEIFQIPLLGFIVKSLGAIPVDRKNVNPISVKKSLSILKSGHVLGIFPEGTRSLNGELLPLNAGLVKIALRADSAIIPVGIKGTFDIFPPSAKIPVLFKRNKVYVHFGKPIYLDNTRLKDIQYQQECLLKIQEKIKELTYMIDETGNRSSNNN